MIGLRRFSSKIIRTPEQIEKGIEKVQKFKKFVKQPGIFLPEELFLIHILFIKILNYIIIIIDFSFTNLHDSSIGQWI